MCVFYIGNTNWALGLHIVEEHDLGALGHVVEELVLNHFIGNMSQRAKIMFLDDMEAKGPIRITDVEEAQKSIMRLARKLSDSGDLVLAGRGDDFV